MNFGILLGIGAVVFILIFLTYVLAPTKGQTNLFFWSVLLIICAGLNFSVWIIRDWEDATTLQWVLIEATTFVGCLLISSSRTTKSFPIAWKFLLINSFGLGIAFLGIILILASMHVINQPVDFLAANAASHPEIIWVEIGLWLAIFGYTAKLGLFPNHVWIEDTYGESPTQVSSLLSAFTPVSVCFALRPFVHLDHQLFPHTFSGADGLLVLGIFTILFSIFAVYDRDDIRRISAKVALFHTGALAVFLWLDLNETAFLYMMATNLVVKSLLFISMGIVRMDAGKRELGKIIQADSINKPALSLFILALFLAFVMPGSPIFVTDIVLIKAGQVSGNSLVILVPILGLVFFGVMLYKIAPLLNIKGRAFSKDVATILRIRMTNGFFLTLPSSQHRLLGILSFITGILMKNVTGIFRTSETNQTHRFWLTKAGIERETLSKSQEKNIYEDTANPLWMLRHSLGTDQGPEDYSHIDYEKYLSQERKHQLEKFLTKDGIKDLVYRGFNVPVPASFYSHAVGPIHAGVIEPGHFRFIVEGEEIQNLDIRLGFQKRNLLEKMKGLDKDSISSYAEAISGDSSIAYGIAFSKAFEEAHGIRMPEEIHFARTVLLEIERIAIHIGDIGAIAGDVGYYPLQGVCSMQRGVPLGVMEALTGNRFGRGALAPGKVRLKKDLSESVLADLEKRISNVTQDIVEHFERAAGKSTNRERLQICGVVTHKQIHDLGFVGMVEKCAGISRDLRHHETIYNLTGEMIKLELDSGQMRGDAWSRFYLRYEELKNSGKWLKKAIPLLKNFHKEYDVFSKSKVSKAKSGLYSGFSEGWRGPVLVSFTLNAAGQIKEAYVRDPSVTNWHALELAVRGENIGDFPLNNKSFNLSYVGVDL